MDFNFGFMKYGQKWRDLRRVFHQHLHPGAVGQYSAAQTREVRAFLKRAMDFTDSIDTVSVSQSVDLPSKVLRCLTPFEEHSPP